MGIEEEVVVLPERTRRGQIPHREICRTPVPQLLFVNILTISLFQEEKNPYVKMLDFPIGFAQH